jgi:hypothetical protein
LTVTNQCGVSSSQFLRAWHALIAQMEDGPFFPDSTVLAAAWLSTKICRLVMFSPCVISLRALSTRSVMPRDSAIISVSNEVTFPHPQLTFLSVWPGYTAFNRARPCIQYAAPVIDSPFVHEYDPSVHSSMASGALISVPSKLFWLLDCTKDRFWT